MAGVIATYLAIAVFLYLYFKIQCDIYISMGDEEIDRTTVEIVITLICILWIISLPLLILTKEDDE